MADSNIKMRLISEGLYRYVERIVGSERLIELRRISNDMSDTLANCDLPAYQRHCIGGSSAEGFLLEFSDLDCMYIELDVIVVSTKMCYQAFMKRDLTTVVMETENVSPGYALLRCLNKGTKYVDGDELIRIGSDVYISSKFIRENFLQFQTGTIHGPCSRYRMLAIDLDTVYTLKCPFWPDVAMPFINRSLRQGWPNIDLITDICKDGCLLVPINSKQETCSDMADFEWRISFSVVEKKLTHSMNHTQFLCFGYLKLFLHEINRICKEPKELLCSYFMKTALLWEISGSSQKWQPQNFLYKFWNVFRRIMYWVSIGYCPNYFIPENNLFQGKIFGSRQRKLMTALSVFHGHGFQSLIAEDLSLLLDDPGRYMTSPTHQQDFSCAHRINNLISSMCHDGDDVNELITGVCRVADLKSTYIEMTTACKLNANSIMQRIARILYNDPFSPAFSLMQNKRRFKSIKNAKCLFRRAHSSFCMREMLLASCAYLNGEYYKLFQIVNVIQKKLQRDYIYSWCIFSKRDSIFSFKQQGMSDETIMKTRVLDDFRYETWESQLLHQDSEVNETNSGRDTLELPPLVFLNLLLILSYSRLNLKDNRNKVLHDLQHLLCNDNNYHISKYRKAISWEILGICQQLCGNYHSAYHSYLKALNDQYNNFKQATIARIITLFLKIWRTRRTAFVV